MLNLNTGYNVWFQASDAMSMTSPAFWDFTQRTFVVSYRRFGIT